MEDFSKTIFTFMIHKSTSSCPEYVHICLYRRHQHYWQALNLNVAINLTIIYERTTQYDLVFFFFQVVKFLSTIKFNFHIDTTKKSSFVANPYNMIWYQNKVIAVKLSRLALLCKRFGNFVIKILHYLF